MPYLTREDGEHFVIPSYRDVVATKNVSVAKKTIDELSHNYGEYITVREVSPLQYEVAYANDTGYLLGESIWHYFKQPVELIYCEAIPNTTEVILVIVKNWSVYLDGRFPLDSIQEELVGLLTQENHFVIYTYGEVPISETETAGKFSFPKDAVRSFTVLKESVFDTLPLYPQFRLQTVEQALKSKGIGTFPVKNAAYAVSAFVLLIALWMYLRSGGVSVPRSIVAQINPYQTFDEALISPAPADLIDTFLREVSLGFSMPGWMPTTLDYQAGVLLMAVQSNGSNIDTLANWVQRNQGSFTVNPRGITVSLSEAVPARLMPDKIYPLQQVVVRFADNVAAVYPGNHLNIDTMQRLSVYSSMAMTLDIVKLSPAVLSLIGKATAGLPLVLDRISLKVDGDGLLTGQISFEALGT